MARLRKVGVVVEYEPVARHQGKKGRKDTGNRTRKL